jgi:hypothetical protein
MGLTIVNVKLKAKPGAHTFPHFFECLGVNNAYVVNSFPVVPFSRVEVPKSMECHGLKLYLP